MYKIDNQIKKVWNFCEWKCNVPTYNVQYVTRNELKREKICQDTTARIAI